MDRRSFLMGSTVFALTPLGTARAADSPASGPEALFARWLAAFNSQEPAAYRALIATAMPDALAYVDDDLAVREASGGFELIRTAATGPRQITAWVKDRSWDRFSKVVLTAKDDRTIADIVFLGASPPDGFALQRLDEHQALDGFARKLAAEAEAGRFAGAVLVARNGRVLLRRAYGLADIADGRQATAGTRYCIGSMGKMFTAVSILQLIQAGRVGLDDPLARHLPDYPNADLARRVTIAHLLTHTGGTGDVFGPSYDGHAALRPSDFIRLNGQRGPAFEPGTRWGYSNYGFVLLGAVIERTTGNPTKSGIARVSSVPLA
jgi:D-alanyl-D-alanine carboxypeptidase